MKHPRGLWLVLGISLAVNAWGLGWGLPSEYGWAPDEILPADVLEGMSRGFSHGWHSKYPPLHFAVLSVAYAPALAVASAAGLPASGPGLRLALMLSGRAVSLLMAAAVLLVVYRCGRELWDELAGVLAAALLAGSLPFVYYAKLANVDLPYLCWFALSLFFFLRALASHRRRDYVLFALAAAAAVATKDQAYGLYVLAAPALLWDLHRHRDRSSTPHPAPPVFRGAGVNPAPLLEGGGGSRLRRVRLDGWLQTLVDGRMVAALLAGLAGLALFENLVFNPSGFAAHLRSLGDQARSYRALPGGVAGAFAVLRETARHLGFSMGWPAFLLGLAGLLASLPGDPRRRLRLAAAVPAVSYVAFFLVPVLYVYDRFVLPLCLVLALFGGALLARAARSGLPARAAVGVVLAYGLAYALSVDVLMATDARYAAERWLRGAAAGGATVAAVGPLEYLPRLDGLRWRWLDPSVPRLARVRPDLVLVNADFATRAEESSGEDAFYAGLADGSLGYDLAFRHRSRPWPCLLDSAELVREGPDRIDTNLDKVNPEIRVYRAR